MRKTPDVVVIGGGVIGLACAWRLAKRRLQVTLLDRDGGAPRASAASLGVLAPSSPRAHNDFHHLHRVSLDMFEQFARELEEDSGTVVPYRRCGSLEIILSESQYRQAADEVDAVLSQSWTWDGLPAMRLLSPKETKDLEPEAKTGDYGSLYTRVTAQTSAGELLQALRTACRACGVEVREASPVTAIEVAESRTAGVYTEAGFLPCGTVLVCAGAWSSQLHALLGEYCPVKPVRGQALLVEAEKKLIRHVIKCHGVYLVPQSGNLMALGSTTEKGSGFSGDTTAGGIHEILAGALQAVQSLEKATIRRIWAGLRPASGDGKPYIGPVPEISGLFTATGHYKIGFSYAPVTARIIADLLVEGRTDFDIRALLPRKIGKRGKRG